MAATQSMDFLSNLKYVVIFDYIGDTVFMIEEYKQSTQE